MINIDRISKVFYTDDLESRVLWDLSFEVQKGEFVNVTGPSGSGKSTLLSLLGLLEIPTSGHYLLNGCPVQDLSAEDRAIIRNREIGFVFQSFNLIPHLTVYQNVELPLVFRGLGSTDRKTRIMDALTKVGMEHRAGHLPGQLSGGQQQRVAVARACAGRPSVLLADEPTGNLDSSNGAMVMELIQQLHREGSTVVMVTHDARHSGYAQRTIHLLDGKHQSKEERTLDYSGAQ